jgi:guanylate kinase
MDHAGRLIVFVAPSGAGKTTLIHRLLGRHPDIAYSVSATTRAPRPGEVDGRDYTFLDEATFKDGIAAGRFVEWAEVHGHLYGTPREPLDRALGEGRDVLLDLDVAGALALKAAYGPRALTLFVLPPSREELHRRLRSRATDTPQVQALRLQNALAELAAQDRFDHRVVNDDLERACVEIESLLARTPGPSPKERASPSSR